MSLTVLLALTALFAQKRQVMVDKVVAVVGGSSILYSEVEQLSRQLVAERREQGYTSDRDPMNEALEQLMTQKLLFNQGQIDSVEVNEAQIQSSVEDRVQMMIEEEGSIPALEKKHHMAIFHIRSMMQRQMTEQATAQSMRQEVIRRVSIIPGEVEQYYNSIPKDSLPIIADQFVYAHITKFPSSINEAKQRTRERLLEMRERVINKQARFANLAMIYSQDPGTATRGGEMNATLSELDPAFADALEPLRPNQISEVVESQYGFHIIQLLSTRGSRYYFRHILLKPSYTSNELGEALTTLDSLATLIKADSITFEQAAMEHSDDKNSKMNGGIVSNHDILERYQAYDAKLTVTKFLREDFAQFNALPDYNKLVQLKEGEVSSSFLTADIMGNEMAKIVKLVKIIPTHPASMADDYLRLEEMALADKQERVFRKWLTEKIDGMYIHIEPEFRGGDFEYKNWVR